MVKAMQEAENFPLIFQEYRDVIRLNEATKTIHRDILCCQTARRGQFDMSRETSDELGKPISIVARAEDQVTIKSFSRNIIDDVCDGTDSFGLERSGDRLRLRGF